MSELNRSIKRIILEYAIDDLTQSFADICEMDTFYWYINVLNIIIEQTITIGGSQIPMSGRCTVFVIQ